MALPLNLVALDPDLALRVAHLLRPIRGIAEWRASRAGSKGLAALDDSSPLGNAGQWDGSGSTSAEVRMAESTGVPPVNA